jgi:hypothetical protein
MVESLIAPFDAYKGDEPYIFISYAHKNSEIVFEHITHLRNAGFRIWYDEGIDPGTDWSDEIANALSDATVFLVFISPAAVASHNVKKEIVFAIDQRKHMMCIHVEETELPVGLKMQLGNIQSLLEDRFHDREKFYARLFDALPEETRGLDRDGVPVLATSGKSKRRAAHGAPLWKKYKTAFIAATLALAVGLSALVAVNLNKPAATPPLPENQSQPETTPPSPENVPAQTSEIVSFADANLEEALRDVLKNPRGAVTKADLAAISGTLQLAGRGISDITPLQYTKRLMLLNLENNSITDISALQGLKDMTALGLGGNRIKNIAPLRSLKNLTVITLDNNPISDLEPLAALKNLEVLSLEGVVLREVDIQLGKFIRRLKSITVNNASFVNLTPDQVRIFRAELPPNCEIITKNSAGINKGAQ